MAVLVLSCVRWRCVCVFKLRFAVAAVRVTRGSTRHRLPAASGVCKSQPSYQLGLNSCLIEKRALYGVEIEQALIFLLELYAIPNLWFCSTNILLSLRYLGIFKCSELTSLLFTAIEWNMKIRMNNICTTYFGLLMPREITTNWKLVYISAFKDVNLNNK